jgi:hypothetical protein
MSAQAYPLHWPPGFPRAKARERGRFQSNYDQALRNVQTSLRLFAKDSGRKLEHAIMSSNITLTDAQPPDPGVAVWFVWDGMQLCIPVDRYDTPARNLQAIHHVIEARRVELRHGTLALVRATFAGFRALPAPAGKHWRDVLALPSDTRGTKDEIERAYRTLAAVRHPDRGGSAEAMAELNNARTTALQEIG